MPNQIKGQTGKNYGTTTISDSLRTDAGLRISDNLHEVSSRENAPSGTTGKTGGQKNSSRTTDLTNSQGQSGQSYESGVDLDRLAKAVAKQETAKVNAVYRKKGNFPEDKQAIIAHASRISNNNLDFIATLDKENKGTWDVNITSPKNKNGTYDKGICQFNSRYYSHYYKLPEWSNPEWQVNKCWEEYTTAIKRGTINTKFYAYPKRFASKLNFELTKLQGTDHSPSLNN